MNYIYQRLGLIVLHRQMIVSNYGENGVPDTVNTCQEYKIDYVGSGINIKDSETILYKRIDNKIVAIINVRENEWSIATEKTGGSAPLDPV